MYKLTKHTNIIRLADNASIPADPSNRDYAEYLEWLAAGNMPEPADIEPVVVPAIVTMRQARLALLGSGMLASVNSAVAAMTGAEGEAARIEWEYSMVVDRTSPLVVGLGTALNLSEGQLDQLFSTAANL